MSYICMGIKAHFLSMKGCAPSPYAITTESINTSKWLHRETYEQTSSILHTTMNNNHIFNHDFNIVSVRIKKWN